MRTLIFCIRNQLKHIDEAPAIWKVLGGRIFNAGPPSDHHAYSVKDLDAYLSEDENAVAIISCHKDTVMQMGWRSAFHAHVMFSAEFPKDENCRIQARARVQRYPDECYPKVSFQFKDETEGA